jgi:hypothetical protein
LKALVLVSHYKYQFGLHIATNDKLFFIWILMIHHYLCQIKFNLNLYKYHQREKTSVNLFFHIHVVEQGKTNDVVIKMDIINKELVVFAPYMLGKTLLKF